MTDIYNNFKQLLFDGGIDLDTDQIDIALVSDSIAYTPDIDLEETVSDVLDGVVAAEFSDASYTRQTLNVTITQDNANNRAVADASDLSFLGLDGDAIQGVLVFKQVSDDTNSPLIAYVTSADFPLTANGGDVTIEIDADGLLTLN